jgi:phosphoglycerate kinase
MAFRTLDDLGDIRGKRALVRVDLNVPMADGRVTDETRMRALVPTVLELADKGAKVLLHILGVPRAQSIAKCPCRWSSMPCKRCLAARLCLCPK